MENSTSPNHSDFKPKYFSYLSEEDQEKYNKLRSTLSSHACRNRRGKRLETFAEMLNAIKTFCVRGDSDDWKRCLVCGVCWLSNGIAINTRQLGLLIDKCKSSINGSLQKMGYSTLQSRSESSGPLIEAIPELKNNFSELREWTVRLFIARTPQPNLPNYSVQTSFPFASPAPQRSQCYGYPSNPQEFPLYAQGHNMSQPNLMSFASPTPSIHPNQNMHFPPNLPQIPQTQSVSNFNPQMQQNFLPQYPQIQQQSNPQQKPPVQFLNQPQTENPNGIDQNSNSANLPQSPNPDDIQDPNDFFDDPFALTPNFLMSDDQNENNAQDPFDTNF